MHSHSPSVSARLVKKRSWLRLGIATLTSTALVGGCLIPVSSNNFLGHSLVAEASAQEATLSHAQGLAVDLSLLRGFISPEDLGVFDGLVTAIEAQQAWPEDDGEAAQTSQLNIEALNAIRLNLGGISLPLVDDGSGRGLLDLRTDGAGVLSAYASAPAANSAHAAAGVINEDGAINVDPSQGSGNVQTNLQLTALLDQLGLGVVTDGLADELSLRLGAVGSMAEAQGGDVTSEYAVANAELYLHSPLVEEIGGLVEPGGLGADLDETVNGLLGEDGLVGGQIVGLVSGLLNTLRLGDIRINATTNLEATLDTLLGQPLTSADELVTIDLQSGEVKVNLEKLHGDNLSNLDPNTPLVNAEQLNRIVSTVDGLLESLTERITDTLNDGVLDTQLQLRISVILLGSVEVNGTLSEILAGTAPVTGGGLLGGLLTPLVDGLVRGLGPILGEDDGQGNLQVTILNDIIGNLLTPVNALLGDGPTPGLSALVNNVLGEVAQVTVNYQQNELIAAPGTVAGRPNARRGTLTNPAEDFSVQPLRVELLGLGTDGGVVDLPLARSTVSATAVDAPVLLGIEPNEGPRYGGNDVTLTGTHLASRDDNGDIVGIDTIYVNATAITDFTLDPDAGTATFQAPAWEDLDTTDDAVEVTVATSGIRSEPLGYTYFDTPPVADDNNPGYDYVLIKAGETLPVPQSKDTDLPSGTNFEIDPTFEGPSGWTFSVTDPATGDLEITAPADAPPAMVFPVPVIATYPDGTTDNLNARVNVVMSPFEITEVIPGDGYTTVVFIDGTRVDIPHGQDGQDGQDGAVPEVGENGNWWIDGVDTGVPATGEDGADGTSVQIVSTTVDPDTGTTTVVFSDGNTLVIPAGVDGADGADGTSVRVVGSDLNADGDVVIEFSDGTTVVVPKGVDGADAEALKISNTYSDEDGNTVIEFSDGTVVTVAKGAQGEAGQDGQDGRDGVDGQSPVIGDNGNWWLGDVDTGVKAAGQDGVDGTSVEIESTTVDPDTGTTTVVFSDGNTLVIPAGVDGADGADGTSVRVVGSDLNADGDVVIEFSDGTTVVVPKGVDGIDGVDADPLTITRNYSDEDGNTVIEFSDGTVVTVAKGAQGEPGQDGQAGVDGKSAFDLWIDAGNDGDINDFLESLKGADGAVGADGRPGADGKSAFELWLDAGNEGDIDDFLDSLVGQDGVDGKSAYDLWIDAGNDGTEQDFLDSLVGADGQDGQDGQSPVIGDNGNWWIGGVDTGVKAAGQDGTDGTSVKIEETTEDPETGAITVVFSDGNTLVIPAGVDGADGADGTSVTVERSVINADGDVVIEFSDGTTVVVPKGVDGIDGVDADPLTITDDYLDEDGNTVIEFSDGTVVTVAKGAQGDPGQDGQDGADGKSAFDLWVEAGNPGDINDFLESLRGADGAPGADGQDGKDGVDGKSAFELWLDAGNEGDFDDFLDSLVGQDGVDGKSAYDLWIDAGNDGTERDFLDSLVGADGQDGRDGVDGQDGQSPVIGDNGNWWIGDVDTGVKAAGDSITVVRSTIDPESRATTVEFSDGNTLVIPAGVDGADGTSVRVVGFELNADGDVVIEFSDGATVVVPKGVDGIDGVDADPLTITRNYSDEDGNTVIEFSDGTVVTVAKGAQGEPGQDGQDGRDGVDGQDGKDGKDGADGKSAFDLWVEAGNPGDINDFLESLKGADGAVGADGRPGADGKSAFELWREAGNEGSEKDFLDSLVGQDGVDGKSAYDLWLEAGNEGSKQDFLDSLVGADGQDGQDGKDGQDGRDGVDGQDGQTPVIGGNGNWWIGDVDTGVKAKGEDGQDGESPEIGDNGNWWIGDVDTGVEAQGPKGDKGDKGDQGEPGTGSSTGSSDAGLNLGSSLGKCTTEEAAGLIALLGVLGAVGIASAPAVSDFFETTGKASAEIFPPLKLSGPNSPSWLVTVDQALTRVGTTVNELAGPFVAVIGVVAALSAVSATCSPTAGSSKA